MKTEDSTWKRSGNHLVFGFDGHPKSGACSPRKHDGSRECALGCRRICTKSLRPPKRQLDLTILKLGPGSGTHFPWYLETPGVTIRTKPETPIMFSRDARSFGRDRQEPLHPQLRATAEVEVTVQ